MILQDETTIQLQCRIFELWEDVVYVESGEYDIGSGCA